MKEGIQLLLAIQAYSLVLLTANIEDVRKIAQQFVSASIADQLTQYIAEASIIKASNISEENIQNDDINRISDNEWNLYHNPPRESCSSSDEQNKVTKATTKLSVSEDSLESHETKTKHSAIRGNLFDKQNQRNFHLNRLKKKEDILDYVHKYTFEGDNLMTPKFKWKKAETFDYLPSSNQRYQNPYLYNSLKFPIKRKEEVDSQHYSNINSYDEMLNSDTRTTFKSLLIRPQTSLKQSENKISAEINNYEENSSEMVAPINLGSTKFGDFSVRSKTVTTEAVIDEFDHIENSVHSKDYVLATSGPVKIYKPTPKLAKSPEENLVNGENNLLSQTFESDEAFDIDFRKHLKRIENVIEEENQEIPSNVTKQRITEIDADNEAISIERKHKETKSQEQYNENYLEDN